MSGGKGIKDWRDSTTDKAFALNKVQSLEPHMFPWTPQGAIFEHIASHMESTIS